jgi:hypothetical protein
MKQSALDQERADTMASRDAMAQALIASGVPPEEAKTLSVNPAAAKIRLDQIATDKQKAAEREWISGFGGLGGLGGIPATQPAADDVSGLPAVSDASTAQSAPVTAPVARQSLFGLPGAAQADYNHFRTDAAPPSDQFLEPVENIPQVPAQSPASGKPSGNKTMDYLQKNHPEVAALVNDETGITPRDGLEIAQIQKQGQKRAADTQAQLDTLYQQRDSIARRLAMAPDQNAMQRAKIAYLDPLDAQIARLEKRKASTFDQRAAAATEYGIDPNSEEGRNFILTGKLPDPPNARDQFGLNPIYGKDKDGNLVVMQPSKAGGLVKADLPDGVTLQPGVDKIDLGTSWGITDRSGSIISVVPKDLAGAESQKAQGKAQGAAAFDLPRVEQNAAQTLDILDRMKKHPGREGSTGFIEGMLPARTSDQVDFQSLVDQTRGQTFLQAFQMLKGGGQITEIEGQKAENAISRLTNYRLSDKDYLQAINDLEDVINKGLTRARKQAGVPGEATSATTPGKTSSGLQWSIEGQ